MHIADKNNQSTNNSTTLHVINERIGHGSAIRVVTAGALVVVIYIFRRYFDLRKTLRKFNSWLMWLSKLIGKGEDTDPPATKAHTGVENQMYYDKTRGRWVERGKEHEADAAQVVAPPPLAFAKKSETTAPSGTGRSLYTDPLAEMGFVKAEAKPVRPQFAMPACKTTHTMFFIFSWS